MTDQDQRDVPAEQDYAEWRGWMEAQNYHFDDDSYQAEAFAAGMQAQRDLNDAQGPHPALPVAVRALRTIAWGATPDLRPITPPLVADEALTAMRRLGVDVETTPAARRSQDGRPS
jgi:hypothetical protein